MINMDSTAKPCFDFAGEFHIALRHAVLYNTLTWLMEFIQAQ